MMVVYADIRTTSRRNVQHFWTIIVICLVGSCSGKSTVSIDFKRHQTPVDDKKFAEISGTSSVLSGNRCRDVCSKVRSECSATCYSPTGTGHQPFTTAWTAYTVTKNDSNKFDCLESCLSKDDDLYMIPNECLAINSMETQDFIPNGLNNNQVIRDVSRMTTTERCALEAYKNSTVCDLELAMPETARKIFNTNRPKFSLCTGGTVMVGARGLYTRFTGTKSFILNQQSEASSRKRRNEKSEGANEDTVLKRSKRTRRSLGKPTSKKSKGKSIIRTKRRVKRRDDGDSKEVCVTEKSVESPSGATHQRTGIDVDLYFHAGYSQWFELGSCQSKTPVISVNIGSSIGRCKSVHTAHRAYFLIETAKTPRIHLFQGCGTVPALDKKYQICYDWVLLPSHCKFFFS